MNKVKQRATFNWDEMERRSEISKSREREKELSSNRSP